jgi:hypothetical protein
MEYSQQKYNGKVDLTAWSFGEDCDVGKRSLGIISRVIHDRLVRDGLDAIVKPKDGKIILSAGINFVDGHPMWFETDVGALIVDAVETFPDEERQQYVAALKAILAKLEG